MTGDLDQISRAIGGLEGEVRGIRELLVTHHDFADKKWDTIEAEIRNDKHATRNVEQKVELLGSAQTKTAQKVDSISDKLSGEDGIEERLSNLERMAQRAMGYIAAIATVGSILGMIASYLAEHLFKLLTEKP